MPQFISVIIPVGNLRTFRKTIDAVLNQSIEKNNYELIVVIPKELSSLTNKNPLVKIIKTEKLYPPGKMRNIGAKHAEGDILCFIDDDCIPEKEWLKVITDKFNQNKKIGAIGCRVVSSEDAFWPRCADYALFTSYQYNTPFFGHLGSAAIAVRKRAFLSVRGFQETLLASEDWDLSLKLTKKGWLCLFNPNAEVKHNHQRDGFVSIIVMGFKSGFRSGLVVQAKHENQMSWPARMLLRFKSPFFYPLAIMPYAASLTLFLIWELRKTEPRIFLFSPFILLSRISYQVGVWVKLLYGNRIID